jgi:hypothetical protein
MNGVALAVSEANSVSRGRKSAGTTLAVLKRCPGTGHDGRAVGDEAEAGFFPHFVRSRVDRSPISNGSALSRRPESSDVGGPGS